MSERLRCASCRRFVEVPCIEEEMFADKEIAQIFDISPDAFLCFWCFSSHEDYQPDHQQPGGAS